MLPVFRYPGSERAYGQSDPQDEIGNLASIAVGFSPVTFTKAADGGAWTR